MAEKAATVPIAGQIKAVQREISYRERLYPRWVERGKISEHEAAYELEAMRSVLATLVEVQEARGFELES